MLGVLVNSSFVFHACVPKSSCYADWLCWRCLLVYCPIVGGKGRTTPASYAKSIDVFVGEYRIPVGF